MLRTAFWLNIVIMMFTLTYNVAVAQTFSCADTAATGISQDDCEVLLKFYDSTDGDNWGPQEGEAWKSSAPVREWEGIKRITNNRITQLDFFHSTLKGPIPPEFGNLSELTEFEINSTQLTGPLPAELANLTKVDLIFISNNQQLTGSIPPELGNMPILLMLWLDENQLTGTIPAALSNLTQLHTLAVNGNQLTGSIPTELGNLSSLATLYLQNNQLSGPIPAELANIPQLSELRLNNNQLSGTLPLELANATNLSHLHLSHNYLEGDIPASFATMLNGLGSLEVNNNCLTVTDPTIRSILDIKDPGWSETQTNCPAHLLNISTRAFTSTDASNVVAGFIIQGSGACDIMIRGFGRGLNFSPNLDTQLTLSSYPDGAILASNTAWQTGNDTAAIPTTLHLPDPSDAGIYRRLNAGAYTVAMAPEGVTGIGLIGVDEVSCDAETQLINISSRAEVKSGQEAVIAGFIVAGVNTVKVMIRGFGRGLGFDDCLDTQLELYRVSPQPNELIASNDDWQTAANAAQIPVNAQLPDATDAGLLMDLTAGAYTAIMTPKAGSCQGIGLVGVDVIQ